jgi:hypothetical protein
VLSGPEGTQWAQDANEQQPVQLDLGALQVGLNPMQIVDDATNHLPGGNS